jgi:translation initiation factor IF-1
VFRVAVVSFLRTIARGTTRMNREKVRIRVGDILTLCEVPSRFELL